MKKKMIGAALTLGIALSTGLADEAQVELKPLSVYSTFETGQIMKAKWLTADTKYQWIQSLGAWITQEGTVNDNLNFRVGMGGIYFNPLPEKPADPFYQKKFFGVGLSEANFTYFTGEQESSPLFLTVGFFPYQYNSDVQNLGEYLFRTGVYPNYIMTGGVTRIKSTSAYLTGVRLGSQLLDGRLRQDIILSSDTDIPPLHDYSLSYVASLKVPGIELGAGIQAYRLLPVDFEKTHPERDSAAIYQISGSDTTFYSYSGTKVMGRLSLDIKAFLPEMGFLNPHDLKVYGEIAVLGIKDYPDPTFPANAYYTKLSERMPYMIGFNFPTFRLLDLLAFEFEWYKSPHPNSIDTYLNGSPIPARPDDPANRKPADDDFKWTVMAEKKLGSHMSLMAQVANDHYRTIDWKGTAEFQEVLRKPDHWYYVMKVAFGF